jgi:hypothetical protein
MIATLAAVAAISLGAAAAYAADADTATMGQQPYAVQSAPVQAPVAGDGQYHAYVSQGSHGTWLFPPAQDSGAN